MSLNASTTSILLNNLTTGGMYTAQVAAFTKVGVGPYSGAVPLALERHHLPTHVTEATSQTWLILLLAFLALIVLLAFGSTLYIRKRHALTKELGHLSGKLNTKVVLKKLFLSYLYNYQVHCLLC